MTKIPKISRFLTILFNSGRILVGLRWLECWKRSKWPVLAVQKENWLFRKDYFYFLNEKGLKLKPKVTKNPKLSIFRIFSAIFVTFSTNFVDQNVAKRKQGTLLVQKVFPKNLMQFSSWRKSQVGTKNDKKPKNFLFSIAMENTFQKKMFQAISWVWML